MREPERGHVSVSRVQKINLTSGAIPLAYSVEGQGPRTLLLIMGLGGRAADWGSGVPSGLAEHFRVVRFDNRGTGASEKPTQSWTLADMANDAASILDAVGAEAAHVMGISMGGAIAQMLALEHPGRVDRLVLMSTFIAGGDIVPPSAEVASIFSPASELPREQIIRTSMRLITAPGFAEKNSEAIEELVRLALAQPTPRATFAMQLQAIVSSDYAARLAQIQNPTLIVHGEVDPLVPIENARRLQAKLPHAALRVLTGCGHLPMWEAPDQVLDSVLAFLTND
jgi:3-oxoadipate enol-lactonase